MRYETTARDFFYETSGTTALTYHITCDDVTIYNGTAVKSPDKPKLRINIGSRISDYLRTSLPDFREFDGVVVPHPEQLRDFKLYDSQGNLLETYRVLYEFSGNPHSGGTYSLSEPIDGKADPRQKVFWGMNSSSSGSVVVTCAEPWILFDDPFIFDYIGDTVTICYTANADFTVSSVEGDWFTVTQSKGSGYTGCLTFTFGDNINAEERTGTICLSAVSIEGITYTECFPVLQETVVISGRTVEIQFYGTYSTMRPDMNAIRNTLKKTGQRFYSSLGELNNTNWCYNSSIGYFKPNFYCKGLGISEEPIMAGLYVLHWAFHMRFAAPGDLPIYAIDASEGLRIVKKYVSVSSSANSLTVGRGLDAYAYLSIDWTFCE